LYAPEATDIVRGTLHRVASRLAALDQRGTMPEQRSVSVRGYITKRGDGRWYAHCIDLTLDALADTPEEALNELAQAMSAYLSWASENGQPLLRRSPLQFQLQYYAAAASDWLRSRSNRPPQEQQGSRRTFRRLQAA
jgi:predicted RNase H-like HicB family nuclease